MALNETDIPIIWEKMNALKGLTAPQFKRFFSDSVVDETRPVAPIINLTIQTFGETVKLIWVSSPSRDVKKYQILRDEILVPDGEILADSKKKE